MKPDILTALEDASKLLDESVHNHNMVVRWDNGDLEGFSGSAFSSAKKAKESAESKALRKSKFIKKNYTVLGPKEFAQLSSAEKKRLKRDWELSGRMDESNENENEVVEDSIDESKFKSVKITYDDGTDITTSVNPNMSDDQIKKHFQVGSSVNVGEGPNDKMAKIKSVEILGVKDWKQNESIEFNSKDVMKYDKEIAKELATVLSVFLFQVEKITGQEFDDANQAEDFIFAAYRMLRTRESGTLKAILRKFDRIGGERMASLFRRELVKDLR